MASDGPGLHSASNLRPRSGMAADATPLRVDNRTARRLLVSLAGLARSAPAARTRAAAEESAARAVERLGMVQLDPIRTVARAHEHILWSRDGGCRPPVFERLIETRRVFEHFTHDAAILPMSYWPHWRRQFARRASAYERGARGRALPSAAATRAILGRIEKEGPLCSRDFDGRADRSVHAWMKKPYKLALEKLWLEGTLAVSHRRGFVKHYDLVERVVPQALLEASRDTKADDAAEIDRLCRDALQRLGVATPGELQRFWEALSPGEVRAWIDAHRRELVDVRVEMADGRHVAMLAFADIEARLAALEQPGTRLRILNPFDPLVRDRRRLARLFGVHFRIEIYVPPEKRRYGYYVYPVLEGTRIVARTEVRAERDRDRLEVRGLWSEPGIRFGAVRRARFAAELERLARLAGVGNVLEPLG